MNERKITEQSEDWGFFTWIARYYEFDLDNSIHYSQCYRIWKARLN